MIFDTKEIIIGGTEWKTAPFRFNRMFTLSGGSGGSYIDILLSGVSPLVLTNALADGLNYLKLFGGCEQRNIPSEYTQLQYIGSTGTQWIDTGINGTQITRFVIKGTCAQTVNSNNSQLLGGTGNSAFTFFGCRVTNGEPFWYCRDSSASLGDPSHLSIIDCTINSSTSQTGTLKDLVTGTTEEFVSLATSAWGFPNENLLLFGGDANRRSIDATCGELQLYTSSGLVRDFIPARRNSDNVLGMYDTVTGNFLTNAGTGTFTAGADTVPTPNTPMNIISNNGVVKVRHQSGLPWGYTLLDYIESTGTQYIDTGYKPNSKTSINVKYYPAISSTFMCIYGIQDGSASNRFYGLISSTQFRIQVNSNAVGTPTFWGLNKDGTFVEGSNGTFAETQCIVDLTVDNVNKRASIKSDEYTGNISFSGTVLGDNLSCTYNMLLFSRSIGGWAENNFSGRIYGFSIKDNGNLVQNLIPARRNSDNALGMFDLVSQTFFTNAGTGTFTAGSPVSDAIEIYTDGTVETVQVIGKNILNPNDWNQNKAVVTGSSNAGAVIDYNGWSTTNFILVSPSTSYTWSSSGNSKFIHYYKSDGTYISSESGSANNTKTITTPENTRLIRLQINAVGGALTNLSQQLELGSTATSYEPYTVLGTATTEMLLKVGNYQDVQSVIDGSVTRNIGIKVLDGTEDWNIHTSGAMGMSIPHTQGDNNLFGYCSHFLGVQSNIPVGNLQMGQFKMTSTSNSIYFKTEYDTVAEWTQFLADQYANGTPVIVVYPLATSTTETVTGQTLTVQQGTNIVTITQASIDDLTMELSYKQSI